VTRRDIDQRRMIDFPLIIKVTYDPIRLTGRLERRGEASNSIWDRLRVRAIGDQIDASVTDATIDLAWPKVLGILRDFGSRQQQQTLNFRFAPEGEAARLIKRFADEVRSARAARDSLTRSIDRETIVRELIQRGLTKRELKPFQLRDLEHLLALPHGANFSVPGAGKTTVTFALHLLTGQPGQHMFVVAPKAAFPAWKSIIEECMDPASLGANIEPFTVLDGRPNEVDQLLRSGASRFLMSYDLMIRQADLITAYLARQPVHLVLDEAHRMKAGPASQRGAFLLNVATLPARRDLLTGTPMPQGPSDLAAQLGFLWPGHGLDLEISRGSPPRTVLGQLYVRTTKQELGLPPARRHFVQVGMSEGQLALYGIVRDESLRQLASAIRGRDAQNIDYVRARRSVMRLLQLSANPVLALRAITGETLGLSSGVVDQVLSEGHSPKMRAVEDHARKLADEGRKVVVWTIFTDTIHELERALADLNPVTLYGAVPAGDEADLGTREGRLARFHRDPECHAIIANPAAAGEGISLHEVCHDAIYLDRSYVSTHYLQSVDRIHRLGLKPETETNIYIYQTKAPRGLGSIDYSVSRRLATKIRGLQQLLDDPDLHEIAFDEESADDPIDYDVDLQDLVDLIEELEGRAPSGAEEEDEA
jgi:SNF2 family DNA or RNA helicase